MESQIINKLFEGLLQNGAIGIVLAFMLWMNYKMIVKLFAVIETNTQAWTNAHEKLDTIEKNTKPRNREDFR